MVNRIRELRKEKNLTQVELAKMLNVSDRSVGFYETGERDPDTDTLNTLAEIFDCSIDYILCRTDIRKSIVNFPIKNIDKYPNIKEASGLALHRKGGYDGLTEKDLEDIDNYIGYIKQKRQKKDK